MNIINKYNIHFSITVLLIILDPLNPQLLPNNSYIFWFAIINTIYQIIFHYLFSFAYIFNYNRNIIFGGSDKQTSLQFITSTMIDYLGWMMMGRINGDWNFLIKYLAYGHISAGIISLINHNYFQKNYINNDNDNIGKIIFTFIDASIRVYQIFTLLNF